MVVEVWSNLPFFQTKRYFMDKTKFLEIAVARNKNKGWVMNGLYCQIQNISKKIKMVKSHLRTLMARQI